MILQERFDKLSSNKKEYDSLYDSDNLYIAWAKQSDDSKLIDFDADIDREYYSWRAKLRGKNKSNCKLHNEENEQESFQGYVYSVKQEQVDMFEKVALMPSMKYGYRLEKYDINLLKQQEQEEILNRLKQEE
jgi:hypothetical protein